MAHAAESLHWYTRKGGTAYEVKGANGNMRPATLRDARKLDLVPSVTSIIKCAAAPGLERWKQDQVLMAALTLPRIEGEAEKAYIERILRDSKEQGKKAAERGTAIHAAIQGYFDSERPTTPETEPFIRCAANAINDWYPDFAWVAEKSFAHPMGFGGKVDLTHHAAQFVADFKTKEFGPNDELRTWDEHAMQLAAYRIGLGVPAAKCAIVYVSANNPGIARLLEIPEDELKQGWKMFEALLAYWKAKNGFESGWMEKAA